MITMRIIAVKLPMMIPMTRDMVADMPESFTDFVSFMWQWQWAVSWMLDGWKRWRRLEKSTFLRIHLLPLLFLLHLLFVLSLLLFVHVVLLVVALNHFVLGLESNTLSANTESQQNDNWLRVASCHWQHYHEVNLRPEFQRGRLVASGSAVGSRKAQVSTLTLIRINITMRIPIDLDTKISLYALSGGLEQSNDFIF